MSATHPIVAGHSDRRVWDNLMAAHILARDEGAKLDRDVIDPIHAEEKRLFGDYAVGRNNPRYEEIEAWHQANGHQPVFKKWEALSDREADTKSALLRMPAPDLAALRWKLDQTFEDDEIALWCEEIVLVMRADFARLLPEGA